MYVSVFIIPQRYVFAIMALLAIANAYTMRVCLNMAITQMVRRTVAVEGDPHYDPDACPDPNTVVEVAGNSTIDLVRVSEVSFIFKKFTSYKNSFVQFTGLQT